MNNRIENKMFDNIYDDSEATALDYLNYLFDHTTDGILIIPRWDNDDKGTEEKIHTYYDCYDMSWTGEDVQTLYSEYEAVMKEINTLAENYKELESSEIYADCELLKKWRRYFDDAALVKENTQLINFALTCFLRVLIVASKSAPAIIINNECRSLIEAMALNRFSVSYEQN